MSTSLFVNIRHYGNETNAVKVLCQEKSIIDENKAYMQAKPISKLMEISVKVFFCIVNIFDV